MASVYNGTINQGSDWFLTLIYKDSSGTAINLTGYTANMQLRVNANSTTANLTLSTGSGITITGATGTIAIHATATQTAALLAQNYVYDLEIRSSGGIVTRLIQGTLNVSAEVTRV
jgi:hypothetical protein